VPRSCDRVPGKLITANPSFVFRVLSSVENTSLLGEGLAGAKSDSAAGNGIHRSDTAGWWTTSLLRTTGCLKEPEPTMLRVVSAPPFGIRLRNVLPCTRVSPPESSKSANCVSFGSTRGITSLGRLHGIFVRDNSLTSSLHRDPATVGRKIFMHREKEECAKVCASELLCGGNAPRPYSKKELLNASCR
jgi:hypothetical protein